MPGIDINHDNVCDKMRHDHGYNSRKFWMSLLAMALIVGVGVLSGFAAFGGLAVGLPSIIGGVLGALGIYAGANVSTKFAAASVEKSKTAAAPKKSKKPKKQKKDQEPPMEHG